MMSKMAKGIALTLICLPAMAESGLYAGIGVGEVTLKDSVAGIDIEASDTGFKVFGGYRINEYASVEAAYLDAGTPDDTVYGVTIESDASAFQASLIWHVPVGNRFEVFVRGSLIAWEAENTATDGRLVFTQDNDGADFGYGIGSAFNFTPQFGLRAEFEGAELDGTDLRSLSIGGVIRF
jgi:OOP family OmpA-OmpF porin